MEHRLAIVSFLEAVARRLRQRAACEGLLYLLAFLGGLALAAPLLAHWAGLDVRSAWACAGLAISSLLACYVLAFTLPQRRWSTTSAQAHYVGDCNGALRSDLLSSVEFLQDEAIGGSAELREALIETTARRIEPLRLQALVPYSPVRRPLSLTAAIAILYVATALLEPEALAHGWQQLLEEPTEAPFGGALLAEAPLVGDVDIIVVFPEYSGKPSLDLPSSSGDFEAMAGSTIEISTRTTGFVEHASILLAQTDELESDDEVVLSKTSSTSGSAGTRLSGAFRIMHETYYRFQIQDASGDQVEARARHITLAIDQAPKIELYAPADELDVAKLNRIELAYVATDDFGIERIDLVYTPAGGKEYRQPLEVASAGHAQPGLPSIAPRAPRSAQFKYVWELSQLPLRPGVQIEYHLEAADNDDVQGPNIGRSKSYSLRLFSPRERHEDLLARQKELAEHMLALLASRLIVDAASTKAHREIQRAADEVVVEMGGLVAALRDDELATKKLRTTLDEMRGRMNKRVRREGSLLASLEKRNPGAALTAGQKQLEASDAKIIAELEDDVLLLGDWLRRQDLENLLAISDEVDASRERLDKLFEEFERTGSQEVLDEIEREFKALERKLAEMSEKSSALPEDTLDRFVNDEAIPKDCLEEVRELLEAGDAIEAREQMKKCNDALDQKAQQLEDSLRRLRGESFSEEEKRLDEMMNELADLAQDQDDIATEASDVYQRYADAVTELQKGESADVQKSAGETLKKLNRAVDNIPPAGLTPFTREEMTVLEKRLEDAETMLKRGEMAEALSMAQHAKESLKTIRDELEFSLDEAWSRKGVAAEKAARGALPLAKRLIEQLEAATPSPSEIMSSKDRRKLDKLRRRQKATRNRSEKMLKKAKTQAEGMPGQAGQAMQKGLRAAQEHMKQAEEQMRGRAPSGARQQAREASDRLQEAQESARGAARQKQKHGQAGWRDEPVRIPGAEDYRAPEKFRKEILDAMQDESAPSGFKGQVKQYYKDIIK
ncbi:MAG: hypothetical protein GY811_07800 [Myxococcales bacterium]|nr:hypothetical protein [Myxococcales bacterium]